MDFELRYTPAQEEFRLQVRSWLEDHVPVELTKPAADDHEAFKQYQLKRELGLRLGEQGWLYPSAPPEYGGGGLDIGSVLILQEEMGRYKMGLPPYYDSSGLLGSATVLVWGTEEQKDRLLRPIYTGQVRTWQLLTEPNAGSDLASARLAARRDGDHYVLNGQKIFVGSAHGADRFWMLTNTDPEGQRHQNLSWFMVDAHLPGITIQPLPVLAEVAEGHKNIVFFDDVLVPANCLVGGENNGWKVANTHLELEHGGIGTIQRNPMWDRLMAYCTSARRGGHLLIEDQDIRDALAEVYLRLETLRLLTLRNFWRSYTKQKVAYNGPQVTYLRKTTGLWLTKAILDIAGPAALTKDPDWGAMDGKAEHQQREGIQDLMPGSTVDVQRVVLSRALGLGRRTGQLREA
jgi:alkylation response protein AidB-like acyl-CoA dehydrogenase